MSGLNGVQGIGIARLRRPQGVNSVSRLNLDIAASSAASWRTRLSALKSATLVKYDFCLLEIATK